MAGMKFEYDESGAKFVYFLLSFYAMIIIPATYYFWPRKETKKSDHTEDLSCFEPCRLKNQLLNKDQPRRRIMRKIIAIILLIGWVIFFFLAYKASQIEIEHKEYDPYAILGLDREATEKEVKKQYRELSKTMHPDKGGDEEKFKQLAKAYQALTDEETRKNWKEYGNPDGPGVTQFGIALPKWIVDGKNSYLVLGVYVLIFMILLPIVVGSWWYKSIKYTGDQVLLITNQIYRHFLIRNSQLNLKKAIMILSSSKEFERASNPEVQERPSDNIEVPQLLKELPDMQEKTRERPFSDPYSLKARALIYAHLNRIDLPKETLFKDKNTIISKCPFLINEMINLDANLILYFNLSNENLPKANCPKLESVENLMKLSPMIVQALWKSKNNMLQLPHLDESHLRYFTTKKRRILNIRDFVSLPEIERRSVLRNLTDEQYDDIMRVSAAYPVINMTYALKVIDDEDEHSITAGALTTLVINITRTNMADYINHDTSSPSKGVIEQLNSLEGGAGDELADEQESSANKTSTHKPWEKQKKKGKYLGSKPKPKVASKTAAKKPAKKAEDEKSPAKSDKTETENEETVDEQHNTRRDEEGAGADGEADSALEDESEMSETGAGGSDSEEEVATTSANRSNNKPTSSKSARSDEDKKNKSGSGSDQEQDEYFEKFQRMQKKKEKLETKKKVSHRVYCPYFPQIKQECWWLYVADRKKNNLICSPVYICTLKDTEEIELRFLAPHDPGHYTYYIILRSDSYVDFDVVMPVKLEVLPAKKVESHPQWEFTDEEGPKEGQEQDVDDEYATESESE